MPKFRVQDWLEEWIVEHFFPAYQKDVRAEAFTKGLTEGIVQGAATGERILLKNLYIEGTYKTDIGKMAAKADLSFAKSLMDNKKR